MFCTALGTPLGARNVERRGLGREADLAGLNPEELPRLRVHDLRHTFPSHLIVDLRLDVAQVSRILGHARPSITLDVYTHLFDRAAHAADIRERMARSEFGSLLSSAAVSRVKRLFDRPRLAISVQRRLVPTVQREALATAREQLGRHSRRRERDAAALLEQSGMRMPAVIAHPDQSIGPACGRSSWAVLSLESLDYER